MLPIMRKSKSGGFRGFCLRRNLRANVTNYPTQEKKHPMSPCQQPNSVLPMRTGSFSKNNGLLGTRICWRAPLYDCDELLSVQQNNDVEVHEAPQLCVFLGTLLLG